MSRLKRAIAHILVCDHKHCLKRGARESMKELRTTLREHELRRSVLVTTVECLDQCNDGPVVCVYPDGIWYREVDGECARRIVEEHLLHGRTIDRHVMHDMAQARAKCPLLADLNKDDQGE
jgi:(2Fe-2S) ferredoxin